MKEKENVKSIINSIVSSLKNKELMITQIVRITGLNYRTVKKYLDILKTLDMISEKQSNGRMFYSLKQQKNVDLDSFFGLPFSKDIKEKVFGYYKLIVGKWRKYSNRPLSNLQVYKILYKLNKHFNLGLPFGWYRFGAICAIRFSPEIDYTHYNVVVSESIKKYLDKLIMEVINESAEETKVRHYLEENKNLYLLKEELFKLLRKKNYNINEVKTLFAKMLDLVYSDLDKKSKIIFSDFEEVLNDLDHFGLMNNNIKSLLFQSFELSWQIIALTMFWKDMENYKNERLDIYFLPEIYTLQDELEGCLKEVVKYLPLEENFDKDIEKLHKKAQKLTQSS